ncbi:unnamed protein product [Hydatigera taeniaeformis]|uniref:Zf-3CxxC domain-containing protein n=1 Tax=Hydatigena taeniaeformis TaxID=6205 RepID=A0A0R3WJG9_HYDTA|nr:unnamed protein product [Hydatigera taeniaeformis]
MSICRTPSSLAKWKCQCGQMGGGGGGDIHDKWSCRICANLSTAGHGHLYCLTPVDVPKPNRGFLFCECVGEDCCEGTAQWLGHMHDNQGKLWNTHRLARHSGVPCMQQRDVMNAAPREGDEESLQAQQGLVVLPVAVTSRPAYKPR